MAIRDQLTNTIYQPIGPIDVDWAHPRSEGLIFCAPLNPWTDTVDLVSKNKGTRTGLENYATTSIGTYFLFGASNYIDISALASSLISTTNPVTISWTQDPISPSGYHTIIDFMPSGAATSFIIYQSTSDSAYQFCVGPRSFGEVARFSTGNTADRVLDRYLLHHSGGVHGSNTGWEGYRNGSQMSKLTTATFGSGTTNGFRIGALSDTANDAFEGIIGDLKIWNRVLSQAECEQESTLHGAFQTYKPVHRRIFKLGSLNNYEMSIDAAEYTLTNQTVVTVSDKLLNNSSATYVFNLSDFSIILDRNLFVESNSLSMNFLDKYFFSNKILNITNNTITLEYSDIWVLHAKNIEVSPNSYNINYNNLTILQDCVLPIATESYTFSFQNTEIISSKFVNVDTANFNINTFDIGALAEKNLSITFNTYILDNTHIQYIANRILPIDSTEYILTNLDIVYDAGNVFSLDSIVLSIDAQDINFSAIRFMSIEVYNINITNYNIIYDLSRVLDNHPANLNNTFNNITILNDRLLSPESITFNIIFNNKELITERYLSTNSSIFNLNYNNTNIYHYKVLNIDTNLYNIDYSDTRLLVSAVYNITNSEYTINLNTITFAISEVVNTTNIVGTFITDKQKVNILLDTKNSIFIYDGQSIRII